jgi:hypothetical protein
VRDCQFEKQIWAYDRRRTPIYSEFGRSSTAVHLERGKPLGTPIDKDRKRRSNSDLSVQGSFRGRSTMICCIDYVDDEYFLFEVCILAFV